MVLCSRLHRSNARSELSTPTDTKMTVELGNHATSYTSRSCAMNCVTAIDMSRFQSVHVVSIEDVTTSLEVFSFHENLVSGAPPRWPCTLDCCGDTGVLRALRTEDNEKKTYPDKVAFRERRCLPELGCHPTKGEATKWVHRLYTRTHVASHLLWREARSLATFETTQSSPREQAATEAR
jgi:hypothetical protein